MENIRDLEHLNEQKAQNLCYINYYSTPQCNVCKVLLPKVEKLVAGYDDVTAHYVNTEQHPDAAGQHLVFAVPTLIIFFEGREVARFSRHFGIHQLQEVFDKMFD